MIVVLLKWLFKKNQNTVVTQQETNQTHDYTNRYWGHDYSISQAYDGGQTIEISGWGSGIKKGDYLLLRRGDDSTRYKVKGIRYESDPRDMWFATAKFAPRNNG